MLAVSDGRPSTRYRETRKARKSSFLARYTVFSDASIPAALLSGSAYAEAANAAEEVNLETASITALTGGFALYFMSRRLGAGMSGVVGVVSVVYTFRGRLSVSSRALHRESRHVDGRVSRWNRRGRDSSSPGGRVAQVLDAAAAVAWSVVVPLAPGFWRYSGSWS